MLVTRSQSSQNLKISINFLVSPLLYVVGTEGSVVGESHDILFPPEAHKNTGKISSLMMIQRNWRMGGLVALCLE